MFWDGSACCVYGKQWKAAKGHGHRMKQQQQQWLAQPAG